VSEQQPSEEELRAALEEQLRKITVQDVLLQTVVTLINLAGRRLGLAGEDDSKDLEQAKLAIDSARVLLPFLPKEQSEPIRDALSQIQMAFAREAQGPQEQPPPEPESKIWTPPGS
jgi:hypothetical protein